MLAAIQLAGFDDRRANALRKALGQWGADGSHLAVFADDFRQGARVRGVAEAVIEQVWANIQSFAGYSFCKAHSASYAMVSFQCAYLKAHFPAHFLARVVANEGGFYAPGAYLEEARRCGLAIRGPCVAASPWPTRREDAGGIRCGLHLVPGLARRAAERLLEARERRPFAGLLDLRRRTGLPARMLAVLARAGALDRVRPDLNRHQLGWLAQAVGAAPVQRGADDPAMDCDDPPVPDLPAPTLREAAWERFRALGFLPDGHPIWFCAAPPGLARCRDLARLGTGSQVRLLAWPIARKDVEARPREGRPSRPMAFVTCEDATGLAETVWFPDAYRRYGALLDRGGPLLLDGLLEEDWGVVSVHVRRAAAAKPQAA
jgi:DNA polymerase III alpha subunit